MVKNLGLEKLAAKSTRKPKSAFEIKKATCRHCHFSKLWSLHDFNDLTHPWVFTHLTRQHASRRDALAGLAGLDSVRARRFIKHLHVKS
jgi:hypothetical protein